MFQILRGGCHAHHSREFMMSRPRGLDHYVLLIVQSHSRVNIKDHTFIMDPPFALIVSPNTPYSYSNPIGDYKDSWLHFQYLPDTYDQKDLPKLNQPFPIRHLDFYLLFLRQILWEHMYNASSTQQDNFKALFRLLFNHLLLDYEEKSKKNQFYPYQEQLENLRLSIQNTLHEPHSIKTSAKSLGLSPTYFQSLYSGLFKISFQRDLINMRIDYAKHLLTSSHLKIGALAKACGYTNDVHFYRQFKAITGMTPNAYRKNH